MENIKFGKRLENLMKSRKISNTTITEQAGISKNNIGNYKNGQVPNATILYNLSQILGTSMEYLLTGKEAEDLTPDEKHIIDLYRAADERGKRHIEQCAQAEAQERGSCTSKIG